MRITRLDHADHDGIRACYDVWLAAHAVDDPLSPPLSLPVFRHWLARGWESEPSETWVAADEATGETVGWYRIELPDLENRHRCVRQPHGAARVPAPRGGQRAAAARGGARQGQRADRAARRRPGRLRGRRLRPAGRGGAEPGRRAARAGSAQDPAGPGRLAARDGGGGGGRLLAGVVDGTDPGGAPRPGRRRVQRDERRAALAGPGGRHLGRAAGPRPRRRRAQRRLPARLFGRGDRGIDRRDGRADPGFRRS